MVIVNLMKIMSQLCQLIPTDNASVALVSASAADSHNPNGPDPETLQ